MGNMDDEKEGGGEMPKNSAGGYLPMKSDQIAPPRQGMGWGRVSGCPAFGGEVGVARRE